MYRRFERLLQHTIHTIPDPQLLFGRLNMNIAGTFANGIVDNVIHQFDNRALAGKLGVKADVVDRFFDQLDIRAIRIVDNVIDDEDIRIRHVGLHHLPNLAGTCRNDLNFRFGQVSKLIHQEDVRRFSNSDGQNISDFEQRKHGMFFDKIARQNIEDFRIEHAAVELHVGNPIFQRQAFQNLLFGTIFIIDQQFAQQLAAISL